MTSPSFSFLRPLRTLPALLLLSALTALTALPAQAQIGFGPQIVLAPYAATQGGTISISGDRLLVGGDYRVILVVAANDRRTLATVLNGDGEFQHNIVLPALANGAYSVELTVDNVLRDSAVLRILSPLAITLSPSSPNAGAMVDFGVSGLTEGSLSLVYEGKRAFGPVNVTGGSYNGRMRIPSDRPAGLPATVRLDARNTIGHVTPRVGSRSFTARSPNLNPFATVRNATPTTTTPGPRQRFSVSGTLATNEAVAEDVTVQYFWQSPLGQLIPMGAPMGAVSSNGGFSYEMQTPQIGTMSAAQAAGTGQLSTVTRYRDSNGIFQQQLTNLGSLSSVFDTDAAIDINFVLTGSDGLRIEGARVDLIEADLDELYPPNSNQGPVRLDGMQATQQPTQGTGNPVVEAALGCPASIERQYTDANGRAEFEFGLGVPQGGVNVDGSGPTPQVTIAPTELCNPGGSINTPGFCTVVDPAGVSFKIMVRAVHTGYGYVTPNPERERPVALDVRVDRYTGQIDVDICVPDLACEHRTYQRSANVALTLPDLNRSGLLLGYPNFKRTLPETGTEYAIQVESTTAETVLFKPITDLSALRNETFSPAQIPVRVAEFQYNAGAGRPLRDAALKIYRNGVLTTIPMARVSGGSASCSGEAGAEVWQVALPAPFNEGFRFPRDVYGSLNDVIGYVQASDLDNRTGIMFFKFQFAPLSSDIVALAATPNLDLLINTANPHARRLEVLPAIPSNVAESAAAPSEYNLGPKRSAVDGAAAYEFCIPKTASNCGAVSALDFDHQQFSREPGNQPSGAQSVGAGLIQEITGTPSNPWEVLFDYTVPLFRWYWGIPELLSAEVFADLGVRAEYLLDASFNPAKPADTSATAGGRLAIAVMIGVDIDVLFGILLDAGAAIYGTLQTELVTTADLDSASVDPCLKFTLDFSGWLEIGCPIPNPFDPTCYIPDIEETFNILTSTNPQGCGFAAYGAPSAQAKQLFAGAAPWLWPGAGASNSATAPTAAVPPVTPFPRDLRRALHRSPALAFDGMGNRLLLNLDSEGRLVGREANLREFGTPNIISSGFGIRDVAVSYYSTNRAVAVWAESRLPPGRPSPALTRDSAASNQRLRYALYDGSNWGTPVNLTNGGFGEGQVKLARCRTPLLRGGCTQKVSLVFQRNTEGSVGGDKHIFFAQFDGTRWTTPVQVDQTGTINITPSISYAAGQPVVAWVRYLPTTVGPAVTLNDVTRRYLAVRVMDGVRNEEIDVAPLSRGAAQPAIAGKLNGQIAIAYTTAGSTSYIGTRQALHMGQRNCAPNTSCSFTTWRVQDQHGRSLYVERPSIHFDGAGDAVVSFRGMAYGPVPGASNPEDNLFDDDPIGMVSTRGELMQIRSPLQAGQVHPLALSVDGAMHFQPATAYDALTGEVVSVSVALMMPEFIEQNLRLGMPEVRAAAQTTMIEEGIHMATIADLPDLLVESISTTATQLTPGASIPVTIKIRNRGSAWAVSTGQTAQVRLWWDTPATRVSPSASFALGNLAAGATDSRVIQVAVPSAFGNDERQALRATIVVDSSEGEIDGENNEAVLAIGGMPVPTSLQASSAGGTRFVNLVWDAPVDARIAGYRIYVDDANGVAQPFGSSFNKGWADLSALYGRHRSYRVSSYSARGIESELSAPVTAEPAPAQLGQSLFADGFE